MHIEEEDAVRTIADMASNLTGDQHTIRSTIIDLHFAIETEVKRLLYHALRGTILFADDAERDRKAKVLSDSVDKLPMGTALNLLEATIKLSSWPELESVWDLNQTRNRLSHRRAIEQVTYKGRNPFCDPDCLTQMYFDVWSAKQSFAKLFDRVIDEPLRTNWYYQDLSEAYRKRFGDLSVEEHPKLREYPEW